MLTGSGPLSLHGARSYGRRSRRLFPTGLRGGVPERRWREQCSTRRLSPTGTAEAQRKAFDRAFKAPLEKVAAARGGPVWIARRPADGHRQEADTSGPVRPARRSPGREAGPQATRGAEAPVADTVPLPPRFPLQERGADP